MAGLGSGADGGVVDQPRIGGAHRDRMRGPGHRLTMGVGIPTDHVGRGFVTAEDLLGPQRGFHCLIESGRGQPLGEALHGPGDEPGRHRGIEQRRHQVRGTFDGHIALAGQQDRRNVDVRPVGDVSGSPSRWRRGSGLPAAAAPPPRKQIVHPFHHDRRQVPHLRPAHPRICAIGQIRTTLRTVARRGQCLGSVRRHRRRQPRALAARLPTGLAIGRPFPRRAIRPPLGLGRDRVRRRRAGGIGRIPSQPGLQLSDPHVGPLQLRGQTHHQPSQLLIRGRRRLGRGHNPDDRRSSTHDRA